MPSTLAIVLAAGKGTRMRSELPKVLVPVCGRPMIEFVLEALSASGIEQVMVVVGYRADDVKKLLAFRNHVRFALQEQQLGTGHAVMMCRDAISRHNGPVLIVTGDSPLMQHSSLRTLLSEYNHHHPACLLGTTHKDDPQGLGRIVRDAAGRFQAIVEEKDATPEQRRITEVNMSCYVFDSGELLFALDRIQNKNAQGEYYITDCPGVLLDAGRQVLALPVLQPIESLSINTAEELAAVELVLRKQERCAARDASAEPA